MSGALSVAALEVPDVHYDRVAEVVNEFPQVAHNDQRAHRLNMWFVLATETEAEVEETLQAIAARTGLTVYNLPKEREFHVDRVAAVPNPDRSGDTATGMSVWDVDDRAVARFGEQVGALECVSHCYQRPRHPPVWPYNLFAMLHGQSRDEVLQRADDIARILGRSCRGHDILFSTRTLKETGLRFGGRSRS